MDVYFFYPCIYFPPDVFGGCPDSIRYVSSCDHAHLSCHFSRCEQSKYKVGIQKWTGMQLTPLIFILKYEQTPFKMSLNASFCELVFQSNRFVSCVCVCVYSKSRYDIRINGCTPAARLNIITERRLKGRRR